MPLNYLVFKDVGWVTPELPRGFYTTTSRVEYSPEKVNENDTIVSESNWQGEHCNRKQTHDGPLPCVDDDDDVIIMGQYAPLEEDHADDEDEPITILQPQYMHVFRMFGQESKPTTALVKIMCHHNTFERLPCDGASMLDCHRAHLLQ